MPPFRAPYLALNAFVAPARNRAELWRTLCGIAVTVVFGFLAIQVVLTSLVVWLGMDQARSAIGDVATGATPQGVVELLFLYLPLLAGLLIGLGLLMRRGLSSLIGPPRAALHNFLWTALPLSALWVVLLPLSLLDSTVTAHLTFVQQLPWLPFAIAGLLLQTGTEELMFRGYLQQQLAARFSSRLVWMGVPTLLFGLAHYSGTQYGPVAGLVVLWSALFGLAAADLTARTGNLGAAIGLHFANNTSAVLLLGISGNFGGLALYNANVDPGDLSSGLMFLALDTLTLAISWLAARLILRV